MLLILKGREKAIERSLELALFTAWNTARLTNYSGNRLPDLAKELQKINPQPPRQQSNEEILAAMRAIRATMGGESGKQQPA